MTKVASNPVSTTNARNVEEPAAVWMDVNALKPWDRNPRKNDESVQAVGESVIRLGFGAPIVARREGLRIIAGHTRWKASRWLTKAWEVSTDRERGRWHPDAIRVATERLVPVRVVDLSEHDANLLALADNRLNELAPWDIPELQNILGTYGLDDAALAGWSSDDLEKMATDLLKEAGAEVEPAEDQSDKAKTDFAVLVECATEQEQLHVLSQCENLGFRCRSLV